MEFSRNAFADERIRDEYNRIPKWARAEHMEMNVPQKELWNYMEPYPSGDGRMMAALCRLATLALFVAATFLIAEDSLFLGAIAFLAAACLLSVGGPRPDRPQAPDGQSDDGTPRRHRRRPVPAHAGSAR